MLEVVDQIGQERHGNPRLYEMLVGAIAALAERNSPDGGARLLPQGAGPRGLGPGPRRLRVLRRGGRRALVAFDLVEGGVLCRSCRRGRALSPDGLALLRRTLGGGLAGVLAEPRSPVTDEVTTLATEAMEAHLDRRLRSVRSRPGVVRTGPLGRRRDPTGEPAGAPFGVYVHVPFCRFRCDYCAFATYTDRDHLMAEYASACVAEIGRARVDEGLPPATSVFFGGGTPSRLPADLLLAILDAVPRAAGAEVTVECNPEDVTPELLAAYRSGGVTRVSVGVQSTVPHVLAGLGRRHGAGQAAEAAAAVAGAGFASWNMDLIIGGAGESDARLGAEPGRGGRPGPSAAPRQRLRADRRAGHPAGRRPRPASRRRHPGRPGTSGPTPCWTGAGYRWEEISNWARPGHECRHNGLYWEQGDYRGIGSAAHSHRAGRRWWNVRTPDRYVALVAGRAPGHRRGGGADRRAAPVRSAGPRPAHAGRGPRRDALPDDPDLDGLVERADGRAVLTVRGRLLANAVTARLQVDAGRAAAGPGRGTGASRYHSPYA